MKLIRWTALAGFGFVLWIAGVACAGDGTGMLPPPPPANSLSNDVQPILTANCTDSACHGAPTPQLGMNLSVDLTFSNTVGVPAVEVSTLNRVEPGDPDNSYLIHKLEGTAGAVGGVDTQMPLGRNPLDQSDIDIIRAWIADGAQNN